MIRKQRYRDRESDINSFNFQPSKLKPLLVWPYLESLIWSKPADEQPKDGVQFMLAVMDACEIMSTPGTEANDKLFNAFYGTFDGNYGERRLKSYFE